ncbi:MAG: choice-of-anchor A family protein [Akkermansiaceae bacterium]
MKIKYNKSLLSLVIAAVTVTQANAQSLDALYEYNLITKGDLDIQSEVEGRTLVGGNYVDGGTSNFGIHLNQSPSTISPTLTVVGEVITGSVINVTGGSVVVGGSANGRKFNIQNSQNVSGLTATDNTGISFTETFNQLDLASQQLATFATNSGNTYSTDGGGNVILNIASITDGVTVFNVDESIFGYADGVTGGVNGRQLNLSGLDYSGSTVVINVSSGTDGIINTLHSQGSGFMNGFTDNVIFNFYDAKEVNINNQFFGSILAPNALIDTQGKATIDGSVYANSLVSTNEIHDPLFGGSIKFETVPEPSSTLLLGLGGLGLLARRKR